MLPNNTPQQQGSQPSITTAQSTSGGLRPSDIVIILFSNWHWILLSLILSYGIAKYYLLTTPPTYTRTACILIKDMTKGSLLGTSAYGYSDESLMMANADLNNEVYMLQSPYVMQDVIHRLNLQMSYQIEGQFHSADLYGTNLPIDVKILDIPDQENCSMSITFTGDSVFVMEDFTYNGHAVDSDPLVGRLGKTLVTPIGKVIVSPTAYFYVPERSISVSHMRLQDALSFYSSELTVSSYEASTIIKMVLEDHDTQRAEEILYNLIQIYNEQWMDDRNRVSVSTNQFINDRLKVIEGELGSVDSNISDYKSENLIVGNAEAMASMYINQAANANSQIIDLNNQLYMAKSLRGYLTNEASYTQLLPSSQALGNNNITQQIATYNNLLLRRNNLIAASSLENPIVKDLDTQLASLRYTLISSIDTHINDINVLLRSAQGVKATSNTKVAVSPSQNKYLLSVERQQKVKESLYLFLLQKREENELSQAFTAYNNRIVTPPSGDLAPTSPVALQVYAICGLIGLLVPIGLLLLNEISNTSVRGRKDLDVLNVPFLGEIPMNDPDPRIIRWFKRLKEKLQFYKTHRREDKTLHILVKKGSTNVMNEAFRVVRTNLEFVAGRSNEARVIMLTSFNPNSGKTFITSNISIALTYKDKKVLVIDMDMRKRSLSALVGKRAAGLSNFLGGYVDDYHTLIKPVTDVPNLHVLPAGKIPPNPTELLYETKLDDLLKQVRREYDYIFIDCPPLEIVADATIASRLADMTIFVVRAEALQLTALPDIQKYYDENRLPKMTILLNAPTDAFSRYGYHRYGSRYGYSYGYGRDYSYGYGYAYGKNHESDSEE